MADIMFNVGKGRVVELYKQIKSNNPVNAAFVIVALKTVDADADLKKHENLALLLAGVNNTEADFTDYARIELTDTDLAALPGPNHTTNQYEITWPALQYLNAGGALNNNLTTLLLCYDSDTTLGTDANIEPLGGFAYVKVTDGDTLDIGFASDAFAAA